MNVYIYMYIYIYIYTYIYIYIYTYMNATCAVSLANHLKAVADAFRPLTTHQRY